MDFAVGRDDGVKREQNVVQWPQAPFQGRDVNRRAFEYPGHRREPEAPDRRPDFLVGVVNHNIKHVVDEVDRSKAIITGAIAFLFPEKSYVRKSSSPSKRALSAPEGYPCCSFVLSRTSM